jgi:hypothetical protein
MAPFCPHHTAATRKPSHLNVTVDAICKKKQTEFDEDLRAHIHAIRLLVHSAQVDGIVMRSAPTAPSASTTDAWAPAMEFEEAGFVDWSSTTADESAADEEIVWNEAADCDPMSVDGELAQLLEIDTATRRPSLGDRLGSLAMYWSPWESELLQDEFWDSGSDDENDVAGI